MNRKKAPVVEPHNGKFICPDCKRDFPSKASFSMHWYHAHTTAFKNKSGRKKKIQQVSINEGNNRVAPNNVIPFNYCPGCGLPLTPISLALNLINKHESKEK